jgi:hypothetical protein
MNESFVYVVLTSQSGNYKQTLPNILHVKWVGFHSQNKLSSTVMTVHNSLACISCHSCEK